MKYGFVYVLSNDSMPGIFKIGMTGRTPMQRCDELSKATAAPEPFAVMMYLETVDPVGLEKHIHKIFDHYRVSENREFFRLDLREIHKAFEEWETEGCMLCVSHMAKGLMICADYEDRKNSAHVSTPIIEVEPCSSQS